MENVSVGIMKKTIPSEKTKKQMKKIFFLSFMITILLSCTEKENPLSSDKELLSFSIEKALNSELTTNITGKIIADEIKLTIHESVNPKNLIATIEHNGKSVYIGSEEQKSGITANDFTKPLEYRIKAEDGSIKTYAVNIEWVTGEETVIPHIYIDIHNGEEVTEKEKELDAIIRIDGKDKYDDFIGNTIIRGRGNSTWGMPKKPYRLKLEEKAPLMGLAAYKDWVLLNEYLDGSMLYNAVPFKTGKLLEIPYTNTIIPVELTINGKYRGIYAFTEHKEVGKDRIDIDDDGLLLELDVYYDEDWKFKSKNYQLPVMVQFPKSKNMSEEKLSAIENDFNALEQLVFDNSFPNNNYLDYFDDLSFVNYMIVYQLTLNQEINHPKSTYINKPAGGKYRMGIIWDFDWGYGFEGEGDHYKISSANSPLFWNGTNPGTLFFSRLMSDPHMQSLFKERWDWFKTEKTDELKVYIKLYAEIISVALADDHQVWGPRNGSEDPDTNLNRLMNWLEARIQYIDNYTKNW